MLATPSREEPITLLHFSDIHVQAPVRAMRKRELLSKRAIGLGNLWLRRAHRFSHVRERMQAMADFFGEKSPDAVICTGDVTTVGTHAELRVAEEVLRPFTSAPFGLHLVAGNHDIYIGDTLRDGRFEEILAERGSTEALGQGVRIHELVSVRPNPQPWRSSGRVQNKALAALRSQLDASPAQGWDIVITHYAPRLPDGSPDTYRHGLTNFEELEAVLRQRRRTVLMHGHIHQRYHLTSAQAAVPTFCAGSCTDSKHGGFWVYEIDNDVFRAYAGEWKNGAYELIDAPPIELAG